MNNVHSRWNFLSLTLAALLLAWPASAQDALSTGEVLIASIELLGIGSTPLEQELALFDSNGTLLRVLEGGACQGLQARSATRTILCSAYDRLVVLDPAGSPQRFLLHGKGFEHLGDIAPNGSTGILVGETSSSSGAGSPRIATVRNEELQAAYPIPRSSERRERSRAPGFALGIHSMDLLPDHCTLVYTLGWHYAVDFRRVARFDICSGRPLPDLFRLPESASYAGGIRVLPNGDILVATGGATRRFSQAGEERAIYYGGSRLISLTPDGKGFWAADFSTARRFSLSSPFPISPPIIARYNSISSIAVIDEWRAAKGESLPRPRPSRR